MKQLSVLLLSLLLVLCLAAAGQTGGPNLGSASAPLGDVFVGQASNRSFHWDTSALTANRTVKMPDADVDLGSLGSGTTSTPPATIFPAAVTSVQIFGDSIDKGQGLTQQQQAWGYLVAASLGLPQPANFSVTGNRIADFMVQAYPRTPSASVGSMEMGVANDLIDVVNDPTTTTQILSGYQAFMTWLTLPPSQKTLTPAMTFTGTWGSSTIFGLAGKTCGTAGCTFAFSSTGSVVYVNGWVAPGGSRQIDISVDGAPPVSFTPVLGGINMPTYPFGIRIAGLSSGSHSVVGTVSAIGSGTFNIQWGAGNGIVAQTPFLSIGGSIPRGDNAGYAAITPPLNTAVQSLVTTLAGDGLNIAYVDDYSTMSLTASPTQYEPAKVHPNLVGHLLIAISHLQRFQQQVSLPAPTGVTGDLYAQQLYKAGLTPQVMAAVINSYRNQQSSALFCTGPCPLTGIGNGDSWSSRGATAGVSGWGSDGKVAASRFGNFVYISDATGAHQGNLAVQNGNCLGILSGAPGSLDTCFSRASPGTFNVGTTFGANDGSLNMASLSLLHPVLVGALPAAASNPGAFYRVSDSIGLASEGQACVGGGTPPVVALAWSDGTSWKCF